MRNWIKGLLTVGAVAGLAMAAMAAAPEAKKTEAAKPKKSQYVIGMVAKSNSNPVFLAARTGAEDAAKAWGKKLGVDIRIDWRTPVAEDGQKQAEAVEQLVAGGADGIAVSASDAKLLKAAIDSAVERGTVVVTFDSDVPDSQRLAYFGTNDFECGKQLAGELAKSMGNKGVVAILAGNQNAPNLQARVRGVREGMKAFKDIQILDTYYHAETPQDAVLKVEQVMAANPQITGWAMVGGWPLFTQNALRSVAGRAKVVAVDALPAQLDYVRSGEVDTLLAQQVYEWGTTSVQLIMEKLVENKQPASPIVNAPLVVVNKANVDEYGKNWDRWLGKSK